ncbi:MAG: alpha/beta hydrolase [Acetobacteraceae bacterium]|nr:alpha/beta hydrolase [Acetobacteraceae bacterium]
MDITFLETDGGKLAVEVEGAGPLVICSPGLGDTRDAFGPLAAHLVAGGYRVARVDLRGHGDSSARFASYGDEATAADFLTVAEAFSEGPVILAGASLSAGAAVIAAGRRPERVAGLILLGPFVRNGIGQAMRWLLYAALARPWGPTIWRSQAAKLWPGLGDQAAGRAASTTALLTRPNRWAAFHATSITDHSVVAPWIGRVQAPVLVVMGEADPDWKDPLAEARWVASNFAGAEVLMVSGAGHAPMLECPNEVNPAVSRFLSLIGVAGARKADA